MAYGCVSHDSGEGARTKFVCPSYVSRARHQLVCVSSCIHTQNQPRHQHQTHPSDKHKIMDVVLMCIVAERFSLLYTHIFFFLFYILYICCCLRFHSHLRHRPLFAPPSFARKQFWIETFFFCFLSVSLGVRVYRSICRVGAMRLCAAIHTWCYQQQQHLQQSENFSIDWTHLWKATRINDANNEEILMEGNTAIMSTFSGAGFAVSLCTRLFAN